MNDLGGSNVKCMFKIQMGEGMEEASVHRFKWIIFRTKFNVYSFMKLKFRPFMIILNMCT